MTSVDVTRETESDEQQVRRAIEEFERAVRAKDLAAIMDCYAPDLVAYDMMPPLQFVGKQAYGESWEKGLSMMTGSFDIETKDLHIAVAGDVAIRYGLTRMTFTADDGKQQGGYVRWTSAYRKIGGRWLITHEHNSVPIDMENGKGLMDLKP